MSKNQHTKGLPLMAGNWKMNENHLEAIALVQKLAFTLSDKDFDRVDVAVLPPFTDLRSVQTLVEGDRLRIAYGAQDLSPHDKGAYTGDVSGPMLAKLGCDYVLAGHSERRQYHHEDDALVNAKVKAAFRNEITPIMCVGETLEVRQRGQQVDHCVSQVDGPPGGPVRRAGGQHGDRLRADLGHRHRRGGIAPRTLRKPARQFVSAFPRFTTTKQRKVCVSCMAGRLNPTTLRRSWPSRTSMVPWLVGRASTQVSSRR